MADRDRATVNIEPRRVDAEPVAAIQDLNRKRLV